MEKEELTFVMRRSRALVMFEMLSREFEKPEFGAIDKLASDHAEHWALNDLLGSLETRLEEPFATNYLELLAKAKSEILEESGEVLPWDS
jgi:hypothetical protein